MRFGVWIGRGAVQDRVVRYVVSTIGILQGDRRVDRTIGREGEQTGNRNGDSKTAVHRYGDSAVWRCDA